MEKIKTWMDNYTVVLLFALAKLTMHLVTAKHPDWGFLSTQPLVATEMGSTF